MVLVSFKWEWRQISICTEKIRNGLVLVNGVTYDNAANYFSMAAAESSETLLKGISLLYSSSSS